MSDAASLPEKKVENLSSVLEDPFECTLDYQLRRASLGSMQCLTQHFAELGVKIPEAATLRVIAANPGCSQGGVAKLLGMQRANMVPVVTALVERDLVRREVADGRTNALYLTDSGADLNQRIVMASKEHEQRFFGDMPEDMRKTLLEAASRIRAQIEGG